VLGDTLQQGGLAVRSRWLSVLAATTIILGASASAASASVAPKVLSGWKKAELAFSRADTRWSKVLTQSSVTLAQLQKANLAFAPAVKTFDISLGKIHFSGKTATDIGTLVKANKQEIVVLSHTTSLKSFEAKFTPLEQKYMALQVDLSKDLGIQEAYIML
jgi:hypothetical protein